MTLAVGCYLWGAPGGGFSVDDVFLLKRMIERRMETPHKFICVTDNPSQFEGTDVEAHQLTMPGSLKGMHNKLMHFNPDFGDMVGADRVLMMDLDCAVVGNLDPLVDRDEPVVLWRNPARVPWDKPETEKGKMRAFYNGSMSMVTPGAERMVWSLIHIAHNFYSDQEYLSYMFGKDAPYWDQSDGVFRLEREDTPGSGITEAGLPEHARIVFFVGSEHKPDLPEIQKKHPWINQYRR